MACGLAEAPWQGLWGLLPPAPETSSGAKHYVFQGFKRPYRRNSLFPTNSFSNIRVLVGFKREYRRAGISYPRFAVRDVTLDFCSTYHAFLTKMIS